MKTVLNVKTDKSLKKEAQKTAKDIADQMEITIDKVLKDHFIGTSDQIVEKIRTAADLGMKMMVTIISAPNRTDLELLDVFHDEVMTQL